MTITKTKAAIAVGVLLLLGAKFASSIRKLPVVGGFAS